MSSIQIGIAFIVLSIINLIYLLLGNTLSWTYITGEIIGGIIIVIDGSIDEYRKGKQEVIGEGK